MHVCHDLEKWHFAEWALLLAQTDGPGLHFVRRQLRERREEVRRGKLGIYHESEATQVGSSSHMGVGQDSEEFGDWLLSGL